MSTPEQRAEWWRSTQWTLDGLRLTIPVLLDDMERLLAENTQLRAELREALLEIAGTPPEYLSEMEDQRLDYVTIQVNKKDYASAQRRLTELEERTRGGKA